MARIERFHFSHSRKIDSAYQYVSEAARAGVILQSADSGAGRHVVIDGRSLLNFGSCSYMGLQELPELREGAHRAIDEYGTQFHFSRAYLQCPLYAELDSLLRNIAGRPVVVAPSTSLAHIAALPVLVRDGDHMIIDQFAHASLHTAVQLLSKVPLDIVRHNRMQALEAKLLELRNVPGNVWYIADGLYSMLGDFAPFAELKQLLDRFPKLRLYLDDAHSISWLGSCGRGPALEHFANDDRVVVVMSLNKAFSAAGGALAVPSEEIAARIRQCGGPMLFSGPIQPPMLGAAVASARLHISPKLGLLQSELHARLQACAVGIRKHGLALANDALTPIFQVQCDSPRIVFDVAEQMQERGFYCCVCVFPAVPMNRPGLRFTVTRHNTLQDIEEFVPALAECVANARGKRRMESGISVAAS